MIDLYKIYLHLFAILTNYYRLAAGLIQSTNVI